MSTPSLGRLGLWSPELRLSNRAEAASVAAEIESLGFGTLWIPGRIDNQVLDDVAHLLAATESICVATGILNLWLHEPTDVAKWFLALPKRDQRRVMLGVGVSHRPLIGEVWQKPVVATREFCDALLDAGLPSDNLCLGALGPQMITLARDLTAGAHPFLTTPAHTQKARDILGVGKLLAPVQGFIREQTAERAYAIARAALVKYLKLPNYCNHWLRWGFTQADLDTASDRLVDELFAWGSAAIIANRVQAHWLAGADHVAVQLVRGAAPGDLPSVVAACRELAGVLLPA
ncbi:TIGR03620 family F420-dependent LLM class oxidoreductase [Halioxenophilus sp. WMMB6]|uniref:TIGR03620 family F420-dependent LLM class oxidoreductase n=1 Tax=Halioxenophilus sp. WMMB6 TaxID=3073815 RepID=UPI00295F08ED|nr:TIGR03620 family F420-dependent LLM class oxidoreductase [Halioxenophilus sp. WMMB6]